MTEPKCAECRRKTKELFEEVTKEKSRWVCIDHAPLNTRTTRGSVVYKKRNIYK